MRSTCRRDILSATAATGLSMLGAPHPAKSAPTDLAAADPGPRNAQREAANPSESTPVETDHGNLGSLKYSFSEAHNRHTSAGWAREVTVRQFPIGRRPLASICGWMQVGFESCTGTCRRNGRICCTALHV